MPPLASLCLALLAPSAAAFDYALGRRLTPTWIAHASSEYARWLPPAGREAAAAGTLYPPFSMSPPLEVLDINGSLVTLPQAGAPTVVYALDSSNTGAMAQWADFAGSVDLFLSESLLPDVDPSAATRYAFLSLATTPAGAAKDAAFMLSTLRGRMAALGWPVSNSTAWLARATFGGEPIVPGAARMGWVADLLGNWTNVGASVGAREGELHTGGTRVQRLDAHLGWLPPSPQEGTTLQLSLAGEGGRGCPLSAPAAACALLVTCGGWDAPEAPCSADALPPLLQAAAGAGAAAVVLVAPRGGAPFVAACHDDAACAAPPPGVHATMVSWEAGEALARAVAAAGAAGAALTWRDKAPASGITFSVSAGGALLETGWLQATLRTYSWAAQWLDFERRTQANASASAPHSTLLHVWDGALMQGYPGASARVALPPSPAGMRWAGLQLDLALECPTPWETSCAPWDRQMQVNVCCSGNQSDPTCGGALVELGRYITPFRRGLGRWLSDVSHLLPTLAPDAGVGRSCTFTVSTDAWAQPWLTSLTLRLQAGPPETAPALTQPLWDTGYGNGGINWGVSFDLNYSSHFPNRTVTAPAWAKRAVIGAVLTGHGSDNNNCAEFCVTSHALAVVGAPHGPYSETFDNAGTEFGCTFHTLSGALPNEHGTWLYGRDGWCDGSAVRPWLTDISADLWGPGGVGGTFTVSYAATYEGKPPNPRPQTNMPYFIAHVYVSYYAQ